MRFNWNEKANNDAVYTWVNRQTMMRFIHESNSKNMMRFNTWVKSKKWCCLLLSQKVNNAACIKRQTMMRLYLYQKPKKVYNCAIRQIMMRFKPESKIKSWCGLYLSQKEPMMWFVLESVGKQWCGLYLSQ